MHIRYMVHLVDSTWDIYFIVVSSNLTLQGSYYHDLRFTEKEAETWRD